MPRRSKPGSPEEIRTKLEDLIREFAHELEHGDLRSRVRALVPAFHTLRDLGSSLVPMEGGGKAAARSRILEYLRRYPRTVIDGEELMIVAGIQEWARRVRELRVQFGWKIVTGNTIPQMVESGEIPVDDPSAGMSPDDYLLIEEEPDLEAAYRWNVANEIRNQPGGVRDKILDYLRRNIGKEISGEELKYIARDRKEWARRVRELRTEHGWPVVTRTSGRPDLPIGVYVLEEDRQSPAEDRAIPDSVRGEVLHRDKHTCQKCGWTHECWSRSDPRHLEIHHIIPHVEGGTGEPVNLQALCTVCHDGVHATR